MDQPLEENILASFLRMADQMGTGWMPTFPEVTGDSRRMNSNHGIPAFADALAKGLKVDAKAAFEAGKKALTEKTLVPWSGNPAGEIDGFYWEHGYIPALRDGEVETDPNVGWENRQPVAVSLGTAYDSWALSKLAEAAGNKEDAEYFREWSKNYTLLFNPETLFFHPKDKEGNFIPDLDYNFPGGMGAREYYDENNAWVYRWDVQHDIPGLVVLMGGPERFCMELDRMFATPLGRSKYSFYAKLPDHTGNVGQFSMANEPSLHIPYLYNYAGAPWKTQKRVRQMLDTWFRDDLMGVPGDEDGGGMTSFVVFSSLGLYPVTPGEPVYTIGSPDGSFTAGSWLEVYRGLWLNGAAITTGDEFSVGDELTIEGSLMNYKGTPETKEKTAIVVAFKKSLISVDALDFDKLPCIDTTFNLVVTAKESPLLVTCDADWLQITDVNKDGSYKLHADENTRTAERKAAITIKGPTALKTIEITQAGTPATGMSVTEIIAAADKDKVQTLPSTVVVALTTRGAVLSDGENYIYAYGDKAAALKVGDGVKLSATKTTYYGVPELTFSDTDEVFVDSEGNAVVHPEATDITAKAAEYSSAVAEYVKLSGVLKVSGNYYNMEIDGIDPEVLQGSINYPVDALDAKSFDGKKITVTGYFNGTNVNKNTGVKYVNVIATKIAEFVDNPKGTLKNPYEATELAELLKSGTVPEGNVYARGIINKIDNVSTQYGNAQYWLSTDGSAADLEVYRGFYYGGEKFTEETAEAIKVGDEVVVYGKVKVYGETPEFDANNYLVTINGKAAPSGSGTAEDPYNITKLADLLLSGETVEGEVYAKGIISQIDNVSIQYGNAQYWLSDDGSKKYQLEVYRGLWFGGAKFTSEDQIALGDEVVVCGKVKVYNGTPEFDANNKIISLNGKTE